jgi:hypothetical protein
MQLWHRYWFYPQGFGITIDRVSSNFFLLSHMMITARRWQGGGRNEAVISSQPSSPNEVVAEPGSRMESPGDVVLQASSTPYVHPAMLQSHAFRCVNESTV